MWCDLFQNQVIGRKLRDMILDDVIQKYYKRLYIKNVMWFHTKWLFYRIGYVIDL